MNTMELMSQTDNEMEGEGDTEVEEAEVDRLDLDAPDANPTSTVEPVLVHTWPYRWTRNVAK